MPPIPPIPVEPWPGWGCIIAMLRQHGQPLAACWPGWPGCADCSDCDPVWAAVMGLPHIIDAEVEPDCALAWLIMGQARAGVAAKPAERASAIVIFLILVLPRTKLDSRFPDEQLK